MLQNHKSESFGATGYGKPRGHGLYQKTALAPQRGQIPQPGTEWGPLCLRKDTSFSDVLRLAHPIMIFK